MDKIKGFINGLRYTHIAEGERGGNMACLALGYFLFFLPLITNKGTASGKYVANQGLLLWIASIVISVICGILDGIWLIGWVFALIGALCGLALLLIAIVGFIKTYNDGEMLELPFVGGITIIK